MSSAPSLLCSTPTPSDTKLRSLPSTINLTQTPKQSWVWVYFLYVNEQYVQCQFVDQLRKACNKFLKKDLTGSTKGISQHLNVLYRVANPKTISSLLDKNTTMDQYVKIHNRKKLTSILLGLCQIEGNHSGASLASQLLTITRRFDIEQKIICITTDNASVHHCMALEIESICPHFCSKDHAVGCMAHTIHLAAGDGLKALESDTGDTSTPVDHDDLNPMAISSLTNPPNGLNLQYNSIIGKISRLASYLRHSPQRREKFIKTINLVYDIDKPTNAKTLLLQVPT
ncbi:hypothetical protein O181_008671 [Austropuccinia psidii MF-1]|uniref:DUF659 domain-containing protein n=1 Tax=Austropuccinia psidii MF-1 TaxID=1389203 RepID=A0A9Q3GIR4_9BASI|nr:hypothetical protein [Austropuccinia psidii MF-1]